MGTSSRHETPDKSCREESHAGPQAQKATAKCMPNKPRCAPKAQRRAKEYYSVEGTADDMRHPMLAQPVPRVRKGLLAGRKDERHHSEN